MEECTPDQHEHTHDVPLGIENPVGDKHVKKVLTFAAKNLSNKTLTWQAVAQALRDALDTEWKAAA